MVNISHLPEKFCFKLDEIGKRWIRETFGSDYYNTFNLKFNNYFHYPNRENSDGFLEGKHSFCKIIDNYTLITTDQLFPQPQIPTIEKGVMMLVWDEDEKQAGEREVMYFDGKKYYTRENNICYSYGYKHAKPIPQIPEYTIEEAELKFNIKIKK